MLEEVPGGRPADQHAFLCGRGGTSAHGAVTAVGHFDVAKHAFLYGRDGTSEHATVTAVGHFYIASGSEEHSRPNGLKI